MNELEIASRLNHNLPCVGLYATDGFINEFCWFGANDWCDVRVGSWIVGVRYDGLISWKKRISA